MLKQHQHIEARGENILAAVISGTELNAHLVATAALATDITSAADQYDISTELVEAAITFYREHQSEIDEEYDLAVARIKEHAVSGRQRLEEMRERKRKEQG